MNGNRNIIGFFVSNQPNVFGCSAEDRELASSNSTIFRNYIWGEGGIGEACKSLLWENYGNDLVLILFQFYVNPLSIQLPSLKELEPFRKKEKSIGIPIIIEDANFFDCSDGDRRLFLESEIFRKLRLLEILVKRKKLDSRIDLLLSDLKNVFARSR